MPRRRIAIVLATLLIVVLFAVPVYIGWVFIVEIPRIMGDFAALWNTTDALTHHIFSDKKWPSNWTELSSSLAFVNGDQSLASDLVIINFDVKLDAPQRDVEWFVRLKSGRMQPEQESANKRIRQSIEFYQEKSNSEEATKSEDPAQSSLLSSNRKAAMKASP